MDGSFSLGRKVVEEEDLQLGFVEGEQEVCAGEEDGRRWGAERGGEDGDDGGAAVRRRRRLEDGGVAMTVEKNQWPGQGVAAVVAAAAAAAARRRAAAAARMGRAFLEQPLEREITPFFLQMTARVCWGVPSPLLEPIMGREGKGPT